MNTETSTFKIQTAKKLAGLAVVALAGLGGVVLCQAQQLDSSPAAEREARWEQDLKFFAVEFASRQADFTKLYNQPGFDDELAAIQSETGKLSDADIALRLMRLVASAHVAHTSVGLPAFKLGFRRLPLSFHWYSDGLAVIAATPDYAAALGTRVLRVGSMTPEELLAAAAPYISYENDGWLREQSAGYFQTVTVLQKAGAAGPDGRVTFTVAKPGGQPFTLTVAPWDPRVKQVSVFDGPGVPLALYRKQPGSYYWYEYVKEFKALYVQYDRCQSDPKLAIKDFARDIFDFADSHMVERIVIDLRFNGGGSSIVLYPILAGLRSRPSLASHLYVLIGPGTFSSAEDNAVELRHEFGAVLVGEPAGGKVNSYGEVRSFTLPNSGLHVQYSTRFFKLSTDGDPWMLEPDIRVPRTLDDALAGRDLVLDAALRHSGRPPK
jgi:hypothetical protein